MCIACEMAFLDMFEALSPEEREKILREEAARFACEAPEQTMPAANAAKDEPQP